MKNYTNPLSLFNNDLNSFFYAKIASSHLQTICSFQKSWQLFLTYIDLTGVHKFEYRLQMTEWNILKYDNRMF